MKRFSFFKPLSKALRQLGQEIWLGWLADQFNLFPSERSLLVSFWHRFTYYKFLRPSGTVYLFLDLRVVELQNKLADEKVSSYKKQLIGEFLKALYNPRIRQDIIAFLESPNPNENYRTLWSKIRSAWRLPEEEATIMVLNENHRSANLADGQSEKVIVAEPESVYEEKRDPSPQLHAKTYIIAADIYHEIRGEEDKFEDLCHQVWELTKFVQDHFGMPKVPGTFRKLKGYSYKRIFREHNDNKTGQLKPHFRQIIEHPEIFGEAVVEKAREILRDNFV